MKWLDPKTAFLALVLVWLAIVAVYVLTLMLIAWLVRYWWLVALVLALVITLWGFIRWNRNRLGRW